jgi:hypothetical protein
MSAPEIGLAGGCQCGAIRFATRGTATKIGVCHCRMCQKATGGPFAVYAVFAIEKMVWTRGEPASWASSNIAERLFCARCGTHLAYRPIAKQTIELSTGAFDQPELVAPTYEVGSEGRLAWLDDLNRWPRKTTEANSAIAASGGIVSHQHPDRDEALSAHKTSP